MTRLRLAILQTVDGADQFTGIERDCVEFRRSIVAKVGEELSLRQKVSRFGRHIGFTREEVLEAVDAAIGRKYDEIKYETIRL